MSREQPPTNPILNSNFNSSGGNASTLAPGTSAVQVQPANYAGFNITGAGGGSSSTFGLDDTSRPVHYLCGDCDAKVALKRGDPIRCKECGYRVLYKERTNR